MSPRCDAIDFRFDDQAAILFPWEGVINGTYGVSVSESSSAAGFVAVGGIDTDAVLRRGTSGSQLTLVGAWASTSFDGEGALDGDGSFETGGLSLEGLARIVILGSWVRLLARVVHG